ncbi:MAG: hypothetical protein ACFFDK_10445, partial [Promethearchaeota archaeon]
MTEIITYIFEFITMVISFSATLMLINQKKYSQVPLGNNFLALANSCVGIYALSTIIYSFIGQEWAVIAFLKLGMVAVTIAVLFLFFTMQTLIYSSKWIKIHKFRFWVPLLISLVISLVLIITDFIEVKDAATAETHFQPIPFALFAIFVASMLFYSAFSLHYFGIRKSTGNSRKRMQFFFIGLILIISALIVDVLGNIIENEILFDTLLFGILSCGVTFVAGSFFRS